MAIVDPITQYYARLGRYPGNNRQWWLARAEIDDDSKGIKAGDFLPELLDKLFIGNMRAPRGHYVLNAFEKDRSAVSGVTGLTVETENERPPTVAFYSGRAWFACRSTVYFSQVMSDKFRAGLCYQEADPTSEHISDPIATDGGVIPIPEANRIIRLVPHASGVLVFALNGVWFITGTDSGFTALDISVNKVSPIGCRSPQSVVETETSVFWWSDVGIVGVSESMGQFGPVPGQFDKSNITEETIQSFYNDIDNLVREEVKGVFDPKANTIVWLFRDDDVEATQYNRALILDLTLQAFTPWTFSMFPGLDKPRIKGVFVNERTNSYTLPTDISPSQIEYIVIKGEDVRFAQARNGAFVDWESEDASGLTYDSYIEAGYELFDDAMRNKNITYLFAYFTRTEDEYLGSGETDDPSSCYLTVKWDWANGSHSNKWTTPVQAYRPTRVLFDNPDTGFGMVVSKNKVRGNGKAIQFRFGTDERGRNFDLQGWAIAVTGDASA